MDEVKAMTRAGATVGKAVGTGIRTARVMSQQAAARAERELANRGVSTAEWQDLLAQKATGMSRRELDRKRRRARRLWQKKAGRSRRQLARNTEAARRELAARIDPGPRKRRRWPWILLALGGMAAAAAAALPRRPEELPVAHADPATRPDANSGRPQDTGMVSERNRTRGPGRSR